MAKQTQTFRLYELLKSGKEISTRVLADTLSIKDASVPVYIHEMKDQFKADIESIRDGRRVTGYKLLNAAKIKVPEFRKNALGEVPKKKVVLKGSTSLADELESVNTGIVSESEFNDIKSSLGLDFGFGGRGGSDY